MTLVEKYELKRQSIYAILKKYNVIKQRNIIALSAGERNQLIITAYLAGEAMPSIAEAYGMTRQGVQLILKKNGYGSKDGGASIRSATRIKQEAASKHEKKETYCILKWGCTLDQWQLLRSVHPDFEHTPIARFIQHRNNVAKKNISWSLSLWDWWSIWNESGKYHDRGRTKDSYCMVLKKNADSYEVSSVEIIKVADNLKKLSK